MSVATAVEGLLKEAYRDMDHDGMFPSDWACLKCGKVLNADGNHPAELYAGTYTGLCYGCEKGGKYVEGVRVIDGGFVWNYPPHCPSWRRDRETYVFYWDCEQCHGKGNSHGWYSTARCEACSKRSHTYPPGHDHFEFTRRAMDAAQARFERRMAVHLHQPKRMSRKRRAEAFTAFRDFRPDEFKAIADQTMAEFRRVDEAIKRRKERRQTYVTVKPNEVLDALMNLWRMCNG